MVVFISRMGTCFISVRYDTASFTDDESLERCLAAGFEKVLSYGDPPAPTTGRGTSGKRGSSGAARRTDARTAQR
jgi:hypothetical protein